MLSAAKHPANEPDNTTTKAQEQPMTNKLQSIPIDKLTEHPDNPNRMSSAQLRKLTRNIEYSVADPLRRVGEAF